MSHIVECAIEIGRSGFISIADSAGGDDIGCLSLRAVCRNSQYGWNAQKRTKTYQESP